MNVGKKLYPILSNLVDGRVFQLIRREGADDALPYIVYTPFGSQPETSIDGFLGHEYTQVQIDVYHDDYDELDILANQVIHSINQSIQPSEFLGRQQLYDNDGDLYRQLLEFQFFTTME